MPDSVVPASSDEIAQRHAQEQAQASFNARRDLSVNIGIVGALAITAFGISRLDKPKRKIALGVVGGVVILGAALTAYAVTSVARGGVG